MTKIKQTLTTTATILLTVLTITANAQIIPDSSKIYATFGTRWNQNVPYGTIGGTIQLSKTFFTYIGVDLGGDQRAGFTCFMMRLAHSKKVSCFALLGPNVERIEVNPTAEQYINYLTGASGIIISYKTTRTLHLWLSTSYLITDKDIYLWKFGIGAAMPLII